MNIYHLKYFIDAARFQSVSRSAEANHVSHSAVSQAIKSLEAHFEVPLMFHSKRRFQLTPEGEMCLTEGQKILAQLMETKEQIQASRKEVRGQLTVWAPQSLIVDSLYKALAIYRKKYPLVKVSLMPGAAAQVRAAIASGDVNVGILLDDGHIDMFDALEIKKGQFILVGKKKEMEVRNTAVIVSSQDKIEVHHLRKGFKSKFKKDLEIEMEVMSWGVIKNLVEKNFGIGYVPDYCVAHELDSGRLHRLSAPGNSFQYTISAIWSKQRQIHPNAKLFVDLLKQQCS